MAYDPNQPITIDGGGGGGNRNIEGGRPWWSFLSDMGRSGGDMFNRFVGIRQTPESIGAPIDPSQLGGAASYDFIRDMQAANEAQAQARQNQMGIADLIAARARGEGPSIAEMQLRQSTDQLQNQQAGLIASQRGMNPGLARRSIMGQAAMVQQQMNAQAALLRAQEQQAAQALAAQTYGQMRGQDQSMYDTGTQGGLQQSNILSGAEQANQQAAMEAERIRSEQERANAKARGEPIKAAGETLMSVAKVGGAPKMAGGGMVPGYATGGDNPKNDTVPAWLSPGEAVIPRSVMQSPDAPNRAAEFVAMLKQNAPQGTAENPQQFAMGGMAQRRPATALTFLQRVGSK